MSRVLVTGADGFTGRHLVKALAAQGHEVHGLLRAQACAPVEGVRHLHVAELLDLDTVKSVVKTVQPLAVVHLAAIAFVAHGDADEMYRTNIVGTRNLLSALVESVPSSAPKAVLLASSANVYGNSGHELIDESVPPAPVNDYAVSKLAMEYMARTWMDRLPITLVRPFNYTGVGQSINFLLPKIARHFKDKAAVLELGNLDVERDFSDVRRVVDAYVRLLTSPQPGRLFNVSSGQGYSLRSVLDLAADLTGHRPDVRVNPAFVRTNEVHRLVGDVSALEVAIGPLRTISLRDTLTWMLD